MYKVLIVNGGWSVFWLEMPDAEPRIIPHLDKDGMHTPYSKRQAAYRRCKQLNEALKQMDEQIKSDGAIII